MSATIDMTGQHIGRLTVLTRAGKWNGSKKWAWLCRCDCGTERIFKGEYLRDGRTRSCGCFQREELAQRRTKHGATRKDAHWPEYGVWLTMKNRCTRPDQDSYQYYGGRGISVCERWITGDGTRDGFACFIADMGRRPTEDHSIDRRNNDGNYEPDNCHWATAEEQANNRRKREIQPAEVQPTGAEYLAAG